MAGWGNLFAAIFVGFQNLMKLTMKGVIVAIIFYIYSGKGSTTMKVKDS